MAKQKPSRAFLEALQQEKRRRGEEKPGGGFKTPEWFFNNSQQQQPAAANAPTGPMVAKPRRSLPLPNRKVLLLVGGLGLIAIVTTVAVMFGPKREDAKNSLPGEQVKQTAPQSEVMDVPANPPVTQMPPSHIPVPPPIEQTPRPGQAQVQQRVVGMNYVVMQSFENDARAQEAVNALKAAGISATIEKNHPYAPKWILVIGTDGFAKTASPEYQAYVKKVLAVSEKYAGSSKWKRLEPNAYKWR